MNTVVTILIALLVFAVMIFIHEFGHFIFAKAFKIRVNEFALGMGPAIFKKQWGETLYSLRLLPIGGYCKMEGEDEETDDPRGFGRAKWYKRFFVVAAGAVFNLILGFVIFFSVAASEQVYTAPVIDSIHENTPFYEAGFMRGDKIIKLNDTDIHIYDDLSFFNQRNGNKPVEVTVKRNGEKITAKVDPVLLKTTYSYLEDAIRVESQIGENEPTVDMYSVPEDAGDYEAYIGEVTTEQRYILGFTPEQNVKHTFLSLVYHAFYSTIFNVKLVYVSLLELISGRAPVSEISGPVGIINLIGQASGVSLLSLLSLLGLLTVNLGVMNLLPLPALDGGRLVFILAEAITGKPVDPEKEGIVHLIGFMLLIGLIIFATYNDIVRIFAG